MDKTLSKNPRRVQQAIENLGFDFIVEEVPQSTRTASEAASAVGCEVAQIVKSLIFEDLDSGDPILALVSGENRVDFEKLMSVGAGRPGKADADYARRHSGFAIGGIPPVGHTEAIKTYIDEDLLRFDRVWAAAGPNALFQLDPAALVPLTSGVICDLKLD